MQKAGGGRSIRMSLNEQIKLVQAVASADGNSSSEYS